MSMVEALAAVQAVHDAEVAAWSARVDDLTARLAQVEHAAAVAALRARRESLSLTDWQAGVRPSDDGIAGVLDPDVAWTDLEADAAGVVWLEAGRTYRDVRIWGQPRAKGPGVALDNFQVAGPDPLLAAMPKNKGCWVNFADPIIEGRHGEISAELWVTVRGRAAAVEAPGVHGGRVTLRWVRIHDAVDGLNLTHGGLLGEWLHVYDCRYRNYGDNLQSGGNLHCDGVQVGRDEPAENDGGYVLRFVEVGGTRDGAAYQVPGAGSRGAGHDWSNAAVMVKGEVAGGEPIKLLVEHSRLSGGASSINLAGGAAGDTLAGVTFRDVEIAERLTGWVPPVTNSTNKGRGWYVVRSPKVPGAVLDDVHILGTATPVPVTITAS